METLAVPRSAGNAISGQVDYNQHSHAIDGIVAHAVARLAGSANFDRDQLRVRLEAQDRLRGLTPELSLTDYLEAYCRVYQATAFPRTPEVKAALAAHLMPRPIVLRVAGRFEPLEVEADDVEAMHADYLEWLASEQAAWAHLPNDPDDLSDLDVDDQVEDDDDDSRIDWSDMIPPDGRGPRLAPLPGPDDDQTADLFAPTACLS